MEAYNKILDCCPNAIYSWRKLDNDFILVDYNAAALRITQGKIVDLINSKASDLYQNMPEILADFSQCYAAKGTIEREIPHPLLPNGKLIFSSVKYTFVSPDTMLVHVEDHSRLKQATAAESDQENLAQAVLNATCEYTMVLDANGKILALNSIAAQRLGGENNGLVGSNINDIGSSSSIDFAVDDLCARVKSVAGNCIPARFENCGPEKHFETNIYPVIDSNGEASRVVLYARDITENKRIESELKSIKEHYRTIYDENPTIYFTVDSNGAVLSVNDFGAKQLGYTVKDLIGQSVFMLIHPDDKAHAKEQIRQCIQNPADLCRWEMRKICRNKNVMYVRETARAIQNRNGDANILIACTDITESKLFREELLRIEKAVQSTSDAVLITDNQGMGIYNNRAFQALLGFTLEELNSSGGVTSMYRDNEVIVQISEAFQKGKSWSGETVLAANDDHALPVLLCADAIWDEKQNIIGYVNIFSDITERIQAREERENLIKQLSEAEKMISLGYFTAAIAHELNNPLDIILMKLYRLEQALSDENQNPESREHLAKIKRQVYRISRLSKNVLKYSKPRSIIFKPIEINSLIRSVIDSLGDMISDSIAIDFSLDPELPDIPGDIFGLEIALKNLILNAAEAIEKVGTIRVSSRLFAQGTVELTIEDDGQGIPDDELDKVFEPFFTGAHKSRGTGLGLAICKKILDQHGGSIQIENGKNKGTVATIFLSKKN